MIWFYNEINIGVYQNRLNIESKNIENKAKRKNRVKSYFNTI